MGLTSENYVDEAEKVIKGMIKYDKNGKPKIDLTTSKIRSILAMVTELYNDVIHEKGEVLGQEYIERIQYLRLRIAYEAGREPVVKFFVKKSGLLNYIKSIGNKKGNFLLFARYMEALVAYHKFYGGKD